MTTQPTPACRLVEAFGDCASMAAMYTDEVTWRMNHSLAPNIAGPHVGKEAVCAFNEAVFPSSTNRVPSRSKSWMRLATKRRVWFAW